jgi:hypothetical protein
MEKDAALGSPPSPAAATTGGFMSVEGNGSMARRSIIGRRAAGLVWIAGVIGAEISIWSADWGGLRCGELLSVRVAIPPAMVMEIHVRGTSPVGCAR